VTGDTIKVLKERLETARKKWQLQLSNTPKFHMLINHGPAQLWEHRGCYHMSEES
jgi:hypothetical protein